MSTSQRYQAESGQGMLIMMLGTAAMIGFVALAIDGGRLYTQRRDAQNAADSAALAAARAKCSNGQITTTALSWAARSGYNNDQVTNWVVVRDPPTTGRFANMGFYIEVDITTNITSGMAQLIFRGPMQVTVQAIGHCKPTDTIFAGSTSCSDAVNISASTFTISLGVHTNNDLNVSGGGQGNTIYGSTTYVTEAHWSLNTTFSPYAPTITAPESYPVNYNLSDYAPGGSKMIAAGSQYHSYLCDPGDNNCKIDITWLRQQGFYRNETYTLEDGLYYTPGQIDLNGSTLTGNHVTFVAGRDISMNYATTTLGGFQNNPIAFSSYATDCTHPAIALSGSTLTFTGTLFAPNGQIDIGTSTVTLVGKVIGNTVYIHGSNLNFHSDNTYFIELAH